MSDDKLILTNKNLISQKYKYQIMIIELTYILYIIFIHVAFGFLEAFFYKNYGRFNRKQWIIDSLMFSKYHLIAWIMFMTPIVVFPSVFYFVITSNFYFFIRILLIGAGTFFIVAILEDYLFFILLNINLIPKMFLGTKDG